MKNVTASINHFLHFKFSMTMTKVCTIDTLMFQSRQKQEQSEMATYAYRLPIENWVIMHNLKSCHFGFQWCLKIQYIPRNMHTVFALLCFVVVIHWLIFPYPSGLLHWHCGNLTIAPVPAKQPWWIWINTSCEFIKNDCITTTKQSTTKPCAYFLGYTVCPNIPCVQQWFDYEKYFWVIVYTVGRQTDGWTDRQHHIILLFA